MPSTETPDPRFADIDSWPTRDAVAAMVEGQVAAVRSLESQVAVIAAASEAAADRLKLGGRLVYAGAGTSGRVAVQDGVELGPTFNWPKDRLVYLMAGGDKALIESVEGAEDKGDDARALIASHEVTANDVVIGVAASGRTPFTIAALEAARNQGALTIALANNRDTPLLAVAHHAILVETGSELVAGSTRMKAGTAQKAVLNILSTAIMLRLGRVYRGLMVDMVISNHKLQHRAQGIVAALAQCDEARAIAAVRDAGGNIKLAVMIAMGLSAGTAQGLLDNNHGILRDAIAEWEAS